MSQLFVVLLACSLYWMGFAAPVAAVGEPQILFPAPPVLDVAPDILPQPDPQDVMVVIPSTQEQSAARRKLLAETVAVGLTPEDLQQKVTSLVEFDKALILTWAHGLKFADGRAFARDFDPEHLVDTRLASLFPGSDFYVVRLPGYFGGAAPTPELLQNFEVPLPLQRMNIVAVDTNAVMRLLTDINSRTEYFQVTLPPVLTLPQARIAAAAWLRLSSEYYGQFTVQPRFTINEADFPVVELHGNYMNLDVTGIALADPESNVTGDITVIMRFAVDGKLQFAAETPHLEYGPILMPPMAMPGAGGGPILPPQ